VVRNLIPYFELGGRVALGGGREDYKSVPDSTGAASHQDCHHGSSMLS
jgi:hypothetical protein